VGAGSIGAFSAFTEGEVQQGLRHAFAAGAADYLVQEFVRGTEYAIDTFSADGEHHVCGVFRYEKEIIDQSPLYRSVRPEKNPEILARCADYSRVLLQALDLKFGFAHIEIMMDARGSIWLMELNNRISGGWGILNKLCSLSGMTSQIAVLVQLAAGHTLRSTQYTAAQGASRGLFLFRFDDGAFRDPRAALARFRTVKQVILPQPAGAPWIRGRHMNLTDVGCLAVLHAGSESEIEREALSIFELESAGALV
jgi:hypothetical protein